MGKTWFRTAYSLKIILATIYPGKNIWAKKSEGPVRVSTSSRDVGALLGIAAIWFHYTLLHYHQHLSISLPSNYCSISQNWSTVFVQCDWVYFPPTDFNICVTPDWIAPNICPYYVLLRWTTFRLYYISLDLPTFVQITVPHTRPGLKTTTKRQNQNLDCDSKNYQHG